ncbi:MAG: hypothetical protein QXU18_09115 [Thermoplasmatales archaeon]
MDVKVRREVYHSQGHISVTPKMITSIIRRPKNFEEFKDFMNCAVNVYNSLRPHSLLKYLTLDVFEERVATRVDVNIMKYSRDIFNPINDFFEYSVLREKSGDMQKKVR